jgi:post-segregation antitoxin (ccd killing protein)
MSEKEIISQEYTCKKPHSTRVRKEYWKRTVSITLPQNLLERVRNHGLKISRITEQALLSILDYVEAQNIKNTESMSNCGSNSLPPTRAGSSVWHERLIRNQEVAGSNPARSIIRLKPFLSSNPVENKT